MRLPAFGLPPKPRDPKVLPSNFGPSPGLDAMLCDTPFQLRIHLRRAGLTHRREGIAQPTYGPEPGCSCWTRGNGSASISSFGSPSNLGRSGLSAGRALLGLPTTLSQECSHWAHGNSSAFALGILVAAQGIESGMLLLLPLQYLRFHLTPTIDQDASVMICSPYRWHSPPQLSSLEVPPGAPPVTFWHLTAPGYLPGRSSH
jgi:hypothetical protein